MIHLTLDSSSLEGYKTFSITSNGTTIDFGNVSRDDLRAIISDLYVQSGGLLSTLSREAIEEDIRNFTWKLD